MLNVLVFVTVALTTPVALSLAAIILNSSEKVSFPAEKAPVDFNANKFLDRVLASIRISPAGKSLVKKSLVNLVSSLYVPRIMDGLITCSQRCWRGIG